MINVPRSLQGPDNIKTNNQKRMRKHYKTNKMKKQKRKQKYPQ